MKLTEYPFFIQLHITDRCNLHCSHCYQRPGPGTELFFEELTAVLDKLAGTIEYWDAHYGVETLARVHITGGEPLARNDVFDLLDAARDHGFATSLLTNGTLVTREISRRLLSSGVEDVQVSLDGIRPTHDGLRGKGSFDKAVEGIKNLVSEGIDTHINVTLSKLNYPDIDRLIELVQGLGVSAVSFSRLVACGRGQNLSSALLTLTQITDMSRKIKAGAPPGRPVLSSRDPLFNVVGSSPDEAVSQLDFPPVGAVPAYSESR